MARSYRKSKYGTKKTYRKKTNRKTNYKNNKMVMYKGFKATPNTVTFMSNAQTPYPRRYRCKMHSSIYGNVAAGATTARYFVGMNYAYLPWLGGGWPAAFPSIAGLNPVGYSTITGNMYTKVRVFGSKITIEFLPQALTDTVQVTVTPSGINNLPATVEAAIAQPFTKTLFMSSSKMNSPKGSYIQNYITTSRFAGVSSQAISNDLSGQYTHDYNGIPDSPIFWIVNFTTPDKAVTVVALEYRVKVTYYLELYNDYVPDLPIT